MKLDGKLIASSGDIQLDANGDLNLSAQNLDNTGKSLATSRNLTVNTAQTLTATCDSYNLFPQDKNFNNSAYKVFYENRVREALDDPSKAVGPTTIKFERADPSSVRPDALLVTYVIDGKAKTVLFRNEPHQIPELIE